MEKITTVRTKVINGKEIKIKTTHNKPSKDAIKKFTYSVLELCNRKENEKGVVA